MKPTYRLKKWMLLGAVMAMTHVAAAGLQAHDPDISRRIETKYLHDVTLPPGPLKVTTKKGVVTLSGQVGNLLIRERAQRIAEATLGVRKVVNQIQVKPAAISDKQLASDIRSALLSDIAVDYYQDVAHTVSDGIVTLRGKVESWVEHRRAERVAMGVRGVKGVVNKLVVDWKAPRSDSEIMVDVMETLKYDVYLIGDHLYPKVKNGQVALTGTVASAANKARAIHRAWVLGAKSVDGSQIKVDPTSGLVGAGVAMKRPANPSTPERVEDAALKSAINHLFVLNPYVRQGDPNIMVKDGVVTLTGTVTTLKGHRQAEREAWQIRGVRRVHNHLLIKPEKPATDSQVAASVRSAFLLDPHVERYETTVKVRDGVVHLTGHVDSHYEKLAAEEIASRQNGVIAVRNLLTVPPGAGPYYDIKWDPDHSVGSVIGNYFESKHKTDFEIRQDIRSALFWNPFVSADEVQVKVRDGVATLTGVVDSRSEWNLAEQAAFEGGAAGVRNRLQIN